MKIQRKIDYKLCHRAQLSLEFILVLAITLSFLILWLPLIVNTQNSAQTSIRDFYIQKLLDDISYTSDTLCILGDGNKRELTIIIDEDTKVNSNMNKSFQISLISNTSRFWVTQTKCIMNFSKTLPKGRSTIILENEKNIIKLE